MNMTLLANTHAALAPILGPVAEPLDVIKQVEQHRLFWRPATPRLILIAESHVHTSLTETKCLIESADLPAGLPSGFVRLVYCLGYGENGLLDRPAASKNTGTPQFWKILKSCFECATAPTKFDDILASRTRNTKVRIANKLRTLRAVKESGIWLLDASIAALYQQGEAKPNPKLRQAVIKKSWDSYVQHAVSMAKPEAILCVGIGVARTLAPRLNDLQIPWDAVPQPQSRLSALEHADVFATYYAVSQNPAAIRSLNHRWLKRSSVPTRKAASGHA